MNTARISQITPVALAADGGAAPEWVQLTPKGPELAANDGRKHRLTRPDQVIAAFRAYGHPLPIDVEHATHVRADQGLEAPAYGWVREIETRDGALWGRVEWNEQGAAWVASKAYKFLSIGYAADPATGEITRLISVGLTNTPGFKMPELAKAGTTKENDTMDKAVLDALGLASDATAADAVAKIKDLKLEVHTASAKAPDPTLYVAKAQLDAANAKLTEMEKAETARADQAITAAVDAGVAAGKIAPAAKEGFLAMAKAQGIEAFTATVAKMPVIVGGKSDLDDKDPDKKSTTLSAEEIAVAKQMGLTEAEFATAKAEQEA
ncbi:phage protease [Loktanella sp. TSTF-M6]|uniref:Phage protease n=1 Tax=Loktanella gaetbuli TaxID=2881335 RepID=A0ABS8BS70_9RHOB|nr:phage protease [Loktanella gaetbuli]MCB5198588.1 phage protease [Loktanella gaetbuli]